MEKIYDSVEEIKTKDIKRKHYMHQIPLIVLQYALIV
jgi:hypothetical protein